MRQTFIPYIYTLFFTIISVNTFGQKKHLKLVSKNTHEQTILNKLNYQKIHLNKEAIDQEIHKIISSLSKKGYLSNKLDSITKKDSIYKVFIKTGFKIENAIIKLPENFSFTSSLSYFIKKDTLFIPYKKVEGFLNSISKKMGTHGKSFSTVQLKNIELKYKTIYADLHIKESQKRTIDKVVIKGYENFPEPYIKHYLKIRKKSVFNKQKLARISSSIKLLNFTEETKPPEVLFTKDSTLLYLYLKKKQKNSFDGIVSFSSNENGKVLFNGHLDLKLNNVLNTGEYFDLFWTRIGEERQNFNMATGIPYLLNTPFSTDLSFNIYKQDSTFLNTNFHSKISYGINSRIKISLTYDTENSKDFKKSTSNTIASFSSSFLGFAILYEVPNNNKLFDKKMNLSLHTSFGNRNTKNESVPQLKINFSAAYLIDLNTRSQLYIKNETGYLISRNFIDNEVFRIGGANSIRGYREQSIFTSGYSFLNIEYQYLTNEKSYLYSITDIGYINAINNELQSLIGLGLGYNFIKENNAFKISYSIPKLENNSFSFEMSQIILGWTSFF